MDCFFCSNEIGSSGGKLPSDSSQVTSLEFKRRLIEACDKRSDDWGHLVRSRLLSVVDLPAADALYHHNCYFNFVNKKNIPSNRDNRDEPDRKRPKIGRKEDTAAKDSFMEICKFLETNDDQVTVRDLIEMIN